MRYTANFSMKEPQKNVDLADVEDLNDNFEDIDEIMHNAQISIADAYDSTQTYDVGDVVMYEGLLYKCITAISVAEAWDSAKWERTTAATSGGGGNANVTEITYAQYTNLTPAEKANGTIYCVTDDPNDGTTGGGGAIYSLSEQVVGQWINGKPIYQKTFNITPNSYADISTLNIDTVVSSDGIMELPNSVFYHLNIYGDSTYKGFYETDVGNGRINTTVGSGWMATNICVTLRYTKTSASS